MIKYYKYDPIPKKINQSSRHDSKIEWIVIHDTANYNKGANADAHKRFFSTYRGASAHIFVDSEKALQIIGDSMSAWHCGDNQGFGKSLNGCLNRNSIGVELCLDKDYEEAYKNLVEVVKNLMYYHKIDISHVCMHYHVSRKRCPGSFFDKGLWEKFKKDIQKPRVFDIKVKDSYCEPKRIEEKTMKDSDLSKWAEKAWDWAIKNKITDGKRPKAFMTREEAITTIYRLYEVMKNEK